MTGDSKFFLGVVVAAILAVGAFVMFSGDSTTKVTVGNIDESIDESVGHKLGPDSAPVKIIEFGDFQCPACAVAAPGFEQIQAKNPEKVQIIFRHFPLPSHQNGMNSSLAAEAAGKQNKFWQMYSLLYVNQRQWESLKDPLNTFVSYAKELKIEIDQFKKDYQSPETKKTVEVDRDYGLVLDVDSTPTFYVNKEKYTGSRTVEEWQVLIDAISSAVTPIK